MQAVVNFIFLFLLGSTIVSFAIAVIARAKTGEKEFNKLILYWTFLLVNFLAAAVLSKNPTQITFAFFFQFFPGYIHTKVLRDSRGIDTDWRFFGAVQLLGIITTTTLTLWTDLGFTLSLLPVVVTSSLNFWRPIWNTLVSHRREANWIEKGMGVILLTSIINHFNYAFFRLEESAAWWGWGIAIAQYQCLSIFMPLLINHRREMNEKKKVNSALEMISGQHSNFNLEVDELYRQLEFQMSQKQEYYNKLQVSNRNLEEEREMNEMLIKTVSHDIANPLQAINAYVEMLSSGKIAPNEVEKIFGRIKANLKLSLNMILRIRNAIVTRSQAEYISLAPLSVSSSLKKVIDIFEGKLAEKGLQIVVEYDDGAQVLAEEAALCDHVFSNILSNAIKFSFENQKIFISVKDEGDSVSISFTDNGPGIELKRLEKRFFESTRGTRGEEGTGFGLMVMGYFIRKFNGSYHIRSETQGENRGTTISVSLPKAIPAQLFPVGPETVAHLHN